ncbi:TetR/AcrR family transcriptional regulator [Nocardioides sp. URHA0020]|uniref:TetR/AcrR family transcriptional regulator n=1 Tax=Nocardioides sp. URHA0020 TaxID=1380392 RepID=UPI000490CE7C|nr:TetR family transcriptional regulator [Nocardioides sp. URHA0020]
MSAADETRTRLVEAATAVFAEDGVFTASLVEITRRAGQRNRGAVHYHFGTRESLLVAVLHQHASFLAAREGELLAKARTTPEDDLTAVLEAIVRPAVELAETGPSGRQYLVIVGQLVEEFDRLDEAVAAELTATGGYDVYALLASRMPPLDEALHNERLALITGFILRSVADRARASERSTPGRSQLPTELFVRNLVALAAGMATTPPVDV